LKSAYFWVAARFGVAVGLGVAVKVGPIVGVAVLVSVGLGVFAGVGAGVKIEQAHNTRSNMSKRIDNVRAVDLFCIYPP